MERSEWKHEFTWHMGGCILALIIASIFAQGCAGRLATPKDKKTSALAKPKPTPGAVTPQTDIASPAVAPAGSEESKLMGTYEVGDTICKDINGKVGNTIPRDDSFLKETLIISTSVTTVRDYPLYPCKIQGTMNFVGIDSKSKQVVMTPMTETLLSGDDDCKSMFISDFSTANYGVYSYKVLGNELIITYAGGYCTPEAENNEYPYSEVHLIRVADKKLSDL